MHLKERRVRSSERAARAVRDDTCRRGSYVELHMRCGELDTGWQLRKLVDTATLNSRTEREVDELLHSHALLTLLPRPSEEACQGGEVQPAQRSCHHGLYAGAWSDLCHKLRWL